MKTAVRQTSIDAYHNLNLTKQHKKILGVFYRLRESCIADVARYLFWEKSTVAARMNELKAAGMLIFVGKHKSNATGITSEFYRVKEAEETLF